MPSDQPDGETERLRAELNARREALIKGLVDERIGESADGSEKDDDRDEDDA